MSELTERLEQIRHRPFLEGDRVYISQAVNEIKRLECEVKHLRDLVQAYSDMARSR